MLYLDYAKPLAGGGYILSFFADSVEDLESISHGQKFVTKNGTDYGVPQAGSTVIVTSPNSGKTTYVMDAEGIWVVTEDISYSAVVANPSDAATAKLEKLKVNDTTYANWTESEIKALTGGGGGKLYKHHVEGEGLGTYDYFFVDLILSTAAPLRDMDVKDFVNTYRNYIFYNYCKKGNAYYQAIDCGVNVATGYAFMLVILTSGQTDYFNLSKITTDVVTEL